MFGDMSWRLFAQYLAIKRFPSGGGELLPDHIEYPIHQKCVVLPVPHGIELIVDRTQIVHFGEERRTVLLLGPHITPDTLRDDCLQPLAKRTNSPVVVKRSDPPTDLYHRLLIKIVEVARRNLAGLQLSADKGLIQLNKEPPVGFVIAAA